MNRIFLIIIPSLVPSGPVKGAIALANKLVNRGSVHLVVLKSGPGPSAEIDERVHHTYLWHYSHFFPAKIYHYRQLLAQLSQSAQLISISFCFSADLLNFFCRNKALICTSVRGNLPVNYHMDYGLKGLLLSCFHLFMLRRFHIVFTMTSEMSKQVSRFIGYRPPIVGNFIDEFPLYRYRDVPKPTSSPCFIFVGSLTTRKRPDLLIHSLKVLHNEGYLPTLDIVGDGPLMQPMLSLAADLGLSDYVNFHGHLEQPYSLVRASDALVLPSMSEGMSRAAMEALFLGTPCVLRRVDGNQSLITSGFNGILFDTDGDLPNAMVKVLQLRISPFTKLLPSSCSQDVQTLKFLRILDQSFHD